MDKMYTVQRYRKIKTAVGLRNVIAHNMRHNIYDEKGEEIENEQTKGDWYVPERGKLNRYDKDIKKPEQVLKKRADRIKTANLTRKPQKNAAHAIEGFFSASPTFQEAWINSKQDRKVWDKYLKDSENWAKKTFGKDNVLHVSMHMDEKTPHLHVVMVPIITDPKTNKLAYSSSRFLGGRSGLSTLQTQHHRSVGIKYGLTRGKINSRAKYRELVDIDAHRKENIRREQYLKQQEKNLDLNYEYKESELQREYNEKNKTLRAREQEVEKNEHLLHKEPERNLHPPMKNWFQRTFRRHETTDGQKLGWKKYYERQTGINATKYVKDLEVRNQVVNKELDSATKDVGYYKDRSDHYEKIAKEYLNASSSDLFQKAQEKQQQALKRSNSRGNGITGKGLV